jgi:nucleotide-binding universal stress UspA family protein
MEAMMKNILLLVHDDGGQEARFQAALDITRAVEGHLKCLDVSVMPVLIGDFYSGAGEAMLLADERQQESENRTRLEARLAKEEVSWDWEDATGAMAPCIADAAALADLIVVNRRLNDLPLPDMRAVAGEVVVKSNKPILAVPQDARGVNVCGRVLICWNGSSCSAAALRAAVPLLKLAESVILLEIVEDATESSIEDAAEYLSRYDIHPRISRKHPRVRKPAEIILEEIGEERADYVVMGGFGHQRFVESLLGGVTRTMLAESPVPVFMAH